MDQQYTKHSCQVESCSCAAHAYFFQSLTFLKVYQEMRNYSHLNWVANFLRRNCKVCETMSYSHSNFHLKISDQRKQHGGMSLQSTSPENRQSISICFIYQFFILSLSLFAITQSFSSHLAFFAQNTCLEIHISPLFPFWINVRVNKSPEM